MKKTYPGSCHCGAVRLNCLDDVSADELIAAPVKYFNMRHDDLNNPPAETRHL